MDNRIPFENCQALASQIYDTILKPQLANDKITHREFLFFLTHIFASIEKNYQFEDRPGKRYDNFTHSVLILTIKKLADGE